MAIGKKKRKKMTPGEKAISTLMIILGVLVVFYIGWQIILQSNLLGGENISNGFLFMGNKAINGNSDKLGENSENWLDNDSYTSNEDQINILCVGFDVSGNLTDVLMLVSIDNKAENVNILQIPRDSYVGNWPTGKINAAYTYGEGENKKYRIQNIVNVINSNFQLSVDHYISIGLDNFANAVDAIGGIPVNVPETIPGGGDDSFSPPRYYPTINAGEQVLNGNAAEWLVRQRHSYADADLGREKMQQVFLAGCMKKAKSLGFSEVAKVIPTVVGKVKTDMTTEQLITLAKIMIKIDMENVHCFSVPGEPYWEKNEAYSDKNYYNYSVYSIHKQETADLLNTYFRPYQGAIPAEQLGITEVVTPDNYKVKTPFSQQKSFADIS